LNSRKKYIEASFRKTLAGKPFAGDFRLRLTRALKHTLGAFHPHDQNNKHEMYFLCDDIKKQMAALEKKAVRFGEISEERWGTRTTISLPGGGEIGLYEPKHPVTFGRTSKGQRGNKAKRPKSG
jgi:hypothetical protein